MGLFCLVCGRGVPDRAFDRILFRWVQAAPSTWVCRGCAAAKGGAR